MADESPASVGVMRDAMEKSIAVITEFGGVAARSLDFYKFFIDGIRNFRSATHVIRCLDQVIENLHNKPYIVSLFLFDNGLEIIFV